MQQSFQCSRSALYGRFYFYFASGSCTLQLKGLHAFFHESLLTVTHEHLLTVTHEHILKMNVVLIKECIHIFSQTENAFSIDCEWACEYNTIQQNIHLVRNACMQDEQWSVVLTKYI